MPRCMNVILLVICNSAMTSLAMQSGKYIVMTIASGNPVCSTDIPSKVLPMCPGGEAQCGMQCLMYSCPYYQFKSTTPILCELYNQFPVNSKTIANCIGYRLPPGSPGDCSIPFTYNGVVYNGCVLGVTCWTLSRTSTAFCTSNTVIGVIKDTLSIGNESVPIQSIFDWIILMRRTLSVTYNWDLPWASYKNGFGSVGDSNYWLGLETVSQLTSSSKYKLRIEMKAVLTGKWQSVEYWSFKVGNETATKYQLNVDGYSGDTGNGLQYGGPSGCAMSGFANGMKFSTNGFDSTGRSCATTFRGGGWWYNGCFSACLTCNSTTYFSWIDTSIIGCNRYLISETRLMMKPQ